MEPLKSKQPSCFTIPEAFYPEQQEKEVDMNSIYEHKPHTFTITDSDGRTMTMTLHWDSDITEWMNAFKVVLKWLTFHEETIKNGILAEAEQIEEDNKQEEEKE